MLAQRSAATVAARSTAALPVSVRRNRRSGVSRLRAHAVRPESPVCCPSLTARFWLLGADGRRRSPRRSASGLRRSPELGDGEGRAEALPSSEPRCCRRYADATRFLPGTITL